MIAGRYNEPRILTLKLKNKELIEFNLDNLQLKNSNELLTTSVSEEIGLIRFNNSLGNNLLISEFDDALDQLFDTKALILDLRNTTSGGNSYVARGIMSRFINQNLPYQIHQIQDENWDDQPSVKRSWAEYVSPRGKHYSKPLVVLVGRWTGSMGEGLAIGLDGMDKAMIVGSEMKRLAGGSTNDFHLKNEQVNYKLMTEKLFHVNGTPREEFIPQYYVVQTSIEKDQTLTKALELIKQMALNEI